MSDEAELLPHPAALLPKRLPLRIVALFLLGAVVLFFLIAFLAPWQQTVVGTGRVTTYSPQSREQSIEATVVGRVAKWFVREGDTVSAGEPIVELADNDPNILMRLDAERSATELRLSVEKQRVDTLSARVESLLRVRDAQVASAVAEVEVAEQGVAEKDQALVSAQADQQAALLNFERHQQLFERGLVSKRELEVAEAASATGQAKVDSSLASVEAAKSALSARRAALNRVKASEQANIDNARASLRSAEKDVASTQASLARLDVGIARQRAQTIVAPTSGTIHRVAAAETGAQVSPGVQLAMLVPNTLDRAVELTVDGNDAVLIRSGTRVRLQFEGWPAVQFVGWPSVAVGTFGGRVAFVGPAEQGLGDFNVLVVADDEDESWPPAEILRQGVRTKGWFLLRQVQVWYELWRQLNGFPPAVDPPTRERLGLTKRK